MPSSKDLAQVFIRLSELDSPQENITAFFVYLEKKNLTGLLPQVKEHVLRIAERSDDFNTLTISSRYKLSEKEQSMIADVIGIEGEVSTKEELRDDVVGSFSATYRGTMYDGSLKFALSEMNKALQL